MVYESERNGRLDAIGQIERPRNVLRRPVVVSFNSSRNLAWGDFGGWWAAGGGWRVAGAEWRVVGRELRRVKAIAVRVFF